MQLKLYKMVQNGFQGRDIMTKPNKCRLTRVTLKVIKRTFQRSDNAKRNAC